MLELFKERQDGLLEYCGSTDLPDVIGTWRGLDATIDQGIWAQASIAASIDPVWGKETIKQFAEAVEKSGWYVRQMAKTYKYFTQKSTRVANLSFKHHTISLSHPDPDEALSMAVEHGWSCAKLEEWLINEAVTNSATKKAAKRQRENEFKVFLERVDDLILNDFMQTCPNAEWGRRVFKGWRDEIVWELRLIERVEAADKVADAVLDGAVTVPDIKAKTGLTTREIEGIVGAKVSEGIWELVREGGETEVARGTRRMIIHVVGESVFV